MFKNKILLGVFLSIFLLIFSIPGFAAYYKYTEESGANFYTGTGDHADALENFNEPRQILDDLGFLLGHSLRNDLYPKNGATGGYLGRLNYGVDASKPAVPVVNDLYLATDTVKVYRCFVAGNWVQVYPGTIENNVIKTGDFTAGRIAKINNATGIIEQGTNTDTDVADAVTKKHSQNADTDLDTTFEATFVKKADTVNVLSDVTSPGANIEDAVTKRHSQNADTDLDATFEATFVKKADTVNVLSDITSAGANIEDAVTKKHTQNTDTALGTQTQDLNMGTHKIIGIVDPVNPQEAATKAYADTKVATEVDPTVDTDAEIKAILVDEVTKIGAFPAGQNVIINDASGIIQQGTNTDTEIALAVTKKHSQNTDTITSIAGSLDDHTYKGKTDIKNVGENVVFGDLLYFDWTQTEWMKAKADAYATTRSRRIALETKANGEACLMLVTGYIRDDSAFEFNTATVFLSITTAGATQSTVPSVAGNQIQIVGTAISADIMEYSPSIDIGEI